METDKVVVRQRELGRPVGSEVCILTGHAPMFFEIQPCRARYQRGGSTWAIELSGGFVEVFGDRVTVVTKR